MATHLLCVPYDASPNVLYRNFCFSFDQDSLICCSRPLPLLKMLRWLLAIWWAGTQNCRPGSALGFLSCYFIGIKAGIKSQGSEPSAIKAARAQTTLEETFWVVQSLSGGSCVRCRCQTSLQCRGCSHSPSQPHSLWFFRFAGSKGGNALAALPAASPELADLVLRQKLCVL